MVDDCVVVDGGEEKANRVLRNYALALIYEDVL
jgi:hypothetical protein